MNASISNRHQTYVTPIILLTMESVLWLLPFMAINCFFQLLQTLYAGQRGLCSKSFQVLILYKDICWPVLMFKGSFVNPAQLDLVTLGMVRYLYGEGTWPEK